MNEKKRDQFVDELLEASLSQYGGITPRQGLEGRILAGANAARRRRARFALAGWLTVAATAAIIAIGILSLSRRHEIPTPPNPVDAAIGTVARDSGIDNGNVPKNRTHPSARILPSSPLKDGPKTKFDDNPQLAVFPSPGPLTKEEKLISQFVRETSPSVLATMTSSQSEIPALKKIDDLEIPPLESDSTETKNYE